MFIKKYGNAPAAGLCLNSTRRHMSVSQVIVINAVHCTRHNPLHSFIVDLEITASRRYFCRTQVKPERTLDEKQIIGYGP
jgi:hypothetical protein